MKRAILLFYMILIVSLLSGCWNYREIEKLAIVSGMAIDRGEDSKIHVTIEVVNISSGENGGGINPVYFETDGDSFFDAVREIISLSGKRLYWGHTKVTILSKDIASSEVNRVLDFLMRDTEIREDMWIMVSKSDTAKEILKGPKWLENVQSFELDNALRAQKSVSRYPSVEIYKFINSIKGNKDSASLPAVKNIETPEGIAFHIAGSAIFKRNSLIGWLDEVETKYLLWVRNEVKGGVHVIKNVADSGVDVTLEIMKSKTKVKPLISDGEIMFDISITITANIGGIDGSTDFITEKGREILKNQAEKDIKSGVEEFIKKVQEEYNTDIFGFGRKLEIHYPKVWKQVKDDWDDQFQEARTKANVIVMIAGSGTHRKPIVIGE